MGICQKYEEKNDANNSYENTKQLLIFVNLSCVWVGGSFCVCGGGNKMYVTGRSRGKKRVNIYMYWQ